MFSGNIASEKGSKKVNFSNGWFFFKRWSLLAVTGCENKFSWRANARYFMCLTLSQCITVELFLFVGCKCSWIVTILLVHGDVISWVTDLLYWYAEQLIPSLNVLLDVNSWLRVTQEFRKHCYQQAMLSPQYLIEDIWYNVGMCRVCWTKRVGSALKQPLAITLDWWAIWHWSIFQY